MKHLLQHSLLMTAVVLCVMMAPAQTVTKTDIYIALEGRGEIRLAPRVDTLTDKEEYTYKMTIDPHYRFAELYCDRGLATKVDNFLRITPNSAKSEGMDTVTLRVILFGNNTRILFYKHFIVKVNRKVYPKENQNKNEVVKINNMVLERNMDYRKTNFHEKSSFGFETKDRVSEDEKKVMSVTMSLVNTMYNKNFLIKGDQMTPEIYNEIRKQKLPTKAYVRLEVKVGKKTKSIWSRFTIYT